MSGCVDSAGCSTARYSTSIVCFAGSHRNVGSPKRRPRATISRRDSGNGETPNSTALVRVRPFHGEWVRLLFSSQMPTHGKSARRHTYPKTNCAAGENAANHA